MSNSQDEGAVRRESAQDVFGRRAGYYVTSAAHTDAQVLDRLVELSRLAPDETVLDIGTGTGHTALALAPHAASAVGLDLTPEMLAEAEKLRAARGLANVTWKLGDASSLPFADDSFDVVACRRAAHHFTEMKRSMAEMRRVLRPGGRLLIDDRTVPDDAALDALMNRMDELHDHSHVREYSAAEWVAFCEALGLAVEKVEVYTRHRPLTTLTDSVDPADVAELHRLVKAMTPAQGAALNLEWREDGAWFDHYYLIVAAARTR